MAGCGYRRVLPDESLALARNLAQACALRRKQRSLGAPLRVTRLSGAAPLLVVPVPLPPPAFTLWELSDTARLLVLVIDPGAAISWPRRCCKQPLG